MSPFFSRVTSSPAKVMIGSSRSRTFAHAAASFMRISASAADSPFSVGYKAMAASLSSRLAAFQRSIAR